MTGGWIGAHLTAMEAASTIQQQQSMNYLSQENSQVKNLLVAWQNAYSEMEAKYHQ